MEDGYQLLSPVHIKISTDLITHIFKIELSRNEGRNKGQTKETRIIPWETQCIGYVGH
jgi:hypothetical protein